MTTWTHARNILCIRLDTIGDVLMTTPAIRALKAGAPERRVTLLTSAAGQAIAPLIPDLDDVLTYDAPWMKATAPRLDSHPEWEMADRLRELQFDAAVIFTVFSQNPLPTAMLCYLADVPLRLAHCHENPYQLLTDWVLDPEPSTGIRHEVRRQLDLVATVGCQIRDERMSLRVPAASRQRVLHLLETLGIDLTQPWIVIHPGATAASRCYPPASFAAVARRLVLDHGFQVILTGVAAEQGLVQEIQAQMGARSHSLVDRLSLADMAALIEAVPILLSNNTGPVHMAAALGTPVVDLYALTNPQHTPWAVPHRVLFHDVPCKFCYKSICPEGHHHCLQLLTPEQVIQAIQDLLQYVAKQPSVLSETLALSPPPVLSHAGSAQRIWR